MIKQYRIGDQTYVKVADNRTVHVVRIGDFWRGGKPWQHRALCGGSVAGTPVSRARVRCPRCRDAVETLRDDVQMERELFPENDRKE